MSKSQSTVVITGASAGVGRATARAFAREGAWLGLIARDSDRLRFTKTEVEQLGGRAIIIPADVANSAEIETAASRIESEFGPIDIWINNAMSTVFAPFDQVTPDEFKRATEVTYLGCVYGTMAALKRMKKRDRGVIIQVGSALAYRSIPLQSAYCGAKHGIAGFTDSLRSELLHDKSNVRLTMVNLPAMNTPQFEWSRSRMPCHPQPVPPIFQPEVGANAIVWAASHSRREVNVGLPTVAALLAQKIAPGIADRYLAATGYGSQQMDERIDSPRTGNLFSPVAGNFAAHGRFDAEAHNISIQFWLKKHFRKMALGAGAILAVASLGSLARKLRPAFVEGHDQEIPTSDNRDRISRRITSRIRPAVR